jgi:hypothetical protein
LTHTASTGATSTFSSYVPQHTRESYSTGIGSGTRGSRRQSNLRGVFSKECEYSLTHCDLQSNTGGASLSIIFGAFGEASSA